MTTFCHPLPQSVAQEILTSVVRSVCDNPGQPRAQREAKARAVVHGTLGFQPRDTLEIILASLGIVHFNLILDSAHDVFNGQADTLKARTKSTIVALDRALLGMVKELRVAQTRPVKEAAETPVPEPIEPPAHEPAPPPHPAETETDPNQAVASLPVFEECPPFDPRSDSGTTGEHLAAFRKAIDDLKETVNGLPRPPNESPMMAEAAGD
jgi:hypothetical protein